MIDFKMEDSGNIGVLTMDGELTIQCADELKTVLIRSLDNVEHVVLNFKEVTEMDLSCLQLFCSACRTSAGLNKRLTLTGNHPEAFKRAIRNAGYSCHICCVFDSNKSCLLMEEGN